MFVRKHDMLIPVLLFKLYWCNNSHFPKLVEEGAFTCSFYDRRPYISLTCKFN